MIMILLYCQYHDNDEDDGDDNDDEDDDNYENDDDNYQERRVLPQDQQPSRLHSGSSTGNWFVHYVMTMILSSLNDENDDDDNVAHCCTIFLCIWDGK